MKTLSPQNTFPDQSASLRDAGFDLHHCTLCPRECGADRISGRVGYCGVPYDLYAGRAALLAWEEPCLTGEKGSGAVFFSGCSMGCIFCQNAAISGSRGNFRRNEAGAAFPGIRITPERLKEAFLTLQDEGAATINLVTPTHYLHHIIPALESARREGLSVPVIYNTSAYEKADSLKALEGLVDIYLPDLKYCSSGLSAAYSNAPDYFGRAKEAVAEMVRQQPVPVFAQVTPADGTADEDEVPEPQMLKGVIVRHLALPGCGEDSRAVLRYLYETYGNRIYISLMNQYTPMPAVKNDPQLGHVLREEEYDALVDYMLGLGVENGFIQEGGTASESFIPAFDGTGLL